MINNIQIEIQKSPIDEMLGEMSLVKSYYYQHLRRKAKHQQKNKIIPLNTTPPRGWSSMQSPVNKQSPNKILNTKLLSTFVNIKDARYQIGPAQSYNFKNIEFPDIGNKRSKSPKPRQNIQNFDDSFELLNQSTKYIQRSHVKQSWNKYININSLSRSAYEPKEVKPKSQNNNKFYKRKPKDVTEQNIEGWKSFENQEEEINVVGKP